MLLQLYERFARLKDHQRHWVMNIVKHAKTSDEGMCTFLTGGAGVGKSECIVLLHEILMRYYRTHQPYDLMPDCAYSIMTAPTGRAACNIGGRTLHTAIMIRPHVSFRDQHYPSEEVAILMREYNPGVRVIIIDEASMVGIEFLTMIDYRLRIMMRNNKPFGGLIIILCGTWILHYHTDF